MFIYSFKVTGYSTLEKKNDTSNGLDKVRLYKIIEP